MIPDPGDYFRGFVAPRDELLLELEREARHEHIPLVGPVVGELLSILVQATNARAVLELGTATGYSAIYLARGFGGREGKVTTIERDEALAARARENIARTGLSDRIVVTAGDACTVLDSLVEEYDLIFLDIDKEGYAATLPRCSRLLRPGGLLVADNVAFQAAAPFNEKIFSEPQWRSVHLYCFLPEHSPEQDGLVLAVRTG
jgi:predicted O-methyltransferase YrrM